MFEKVAVRLADGFDGSMTVDGIEISVQMADDNDATPADYECYSDEDVCRFNDGEWKFVGIKMTVAVGSAECSASVWGVDHGYERTGEIEHLRDDILPNLFQEIVTEFGSVPGKLAPHLPA
jgi:hypothetical protein